MPKVLVAYATRAGSTAEVAERVAQRLCAAGMLAEAKPVDEVQEAFFAGRVDPSRLNLLERLAVRVVGSAVGDLRDWNRIDAWADGIASRLGLG